MAFFGGTPGQFKQVSTKTPQQLGLQNQGIQQVLQMLQGGAGARPDTSGFAPIAQQARTQFQQQTIPSIASRFESMGAYGGGDYNRFLAQAGKGLEESLAAQGAQFGQQQQGLQQNLLQLLLGLSNQPSFENVYQPGQQGFLAPLLGSLLGGLSGLAPLGIIGQSPTLMRSLGALRGGQ